MPVPAPADRPVTRAARHRGQLVAVAVAVVLTGLVVSRGEGLAGDLTGGALYAVLVQLLVLLAVPRVRPAVASGTAAAVCVAVELAQLTGAPAQVVAAWPPAAYVLGSTFVATDLLAYAAGVAVATGADLAARRSPG